MIYISLAFAIMPIAASLAFRYAVSMQDDPGRHAAWTGYRSLNSLVLTITVAIWSPIWDLVAHSDSSMSVSWSSLISRTAQLRFFWISPILGLGWFLIIQYTTSKQVSKFRWPFGDIVRLSWWRIVSFVIPLQMVALAFEAMFDGQMKGIAWIAGRP